MPNPRSQRSFLPVALVAAVIGVAAFVFAAAPGCFATEPAPAGASATSSSASGASSASPSASHASTTHAATPDAAATNTATAASAVERDIVSNGGRYVLHVREPACGFVRGESLSFEVRVARADDPTRTLADVALLVDADMPEHLHGLNRVPRVERLADGGFRVDTVYLHMPGWWELFLDVVENSWTERAQMRVVIE